MDSIEYAGKASYPSSCVEVPVCSVSKLEGTAPKLSGDPYFDAVSPTVCGASRFAPLDRATRCFKFPVVVGTPV
jgi:hypothetical protein|tara:strand:- start:19 stop:240 length:222 start_codon:yes stop_codon:yes gene_type:complete